MTNEKLISLRNVLENQRVIRDHSIDHKTLLLIDEALVELIAHRTPPTPPSKAAMDAARELHNACENDWLTTALEAFHADHHAEEWTLMNHRANEERARIAAIIQRHFSAQSAEGQRDKARLDWLQAQLKNMDSTTGGTWLRIGDKGRIQVHRSPVPHHPTELIWHDEICVLDSITEYGTNDVRTAIDSALHLPTQPPAR